MTQARQDVRSRAEAHLTAATKPCMQPGDAKGNEARNNTERQTQDTLTHGKVAFHFFVFF